MKESILPSFICFDLDGTVTAEEILPCIARELNLHEEIKLLTEATMKGVLSFEKSFRLRCRLLSDIPVSRVQEIVAETALDPEIEAFIVAHQDRCCIATGNLDVWIAPLVARLGCQVYSSTAHVVDDRLIDIEQILDKGNVVRSVRSRYGRVVAVGDGMNDASMFEAADVAIAYSGVHDAIPALVDLADFVVTDGRTLCRLVAKL